MAFDLDAITALMPLLAAASDDLLAAEVALADADRAYQEARGVFLNTEAHFNELARKASQMLGLNG